MSASIPHETCPLSLTMSRVGRGSKVCEDEGCNDDVGFSVGDCDGCNEEVGSVVAVGASEELDWSPSLEHTGKCFSLQTISSSVGIVVTKLGPDLIKWLLIDWPEVIACVRIGIGIYP